ncbi:peroxide stress protein YaaA [Cryobacterium sp. TMT1-21]|uniref:Peroxide stress protein YaaA n=1 Tax=Cryobacterium shii TaxID=1259235 RepID=A0AAQ2HEH8_9MICO|nr:MULTISPECIES: peroxide stress protein YaaA [Cryobacterium]TFC42536.1 peroxide stress protein YaaA [Cryobacterium shii]TFC80868.1 peroxide stress protein YaaA [Cryobacterium sp. TmT2-59]TFD13205.1 peroxide stress protein YaaA [Cryobacterium sp. TMT1-21]TFD18626.1 peroxide stress protein YaaA [Cryobacterium sp. TMT4-10]TFD28426.1 peroxide stress protein YaaA [Cryobacterium sp. TMT2-23]
MLILLPPSETKRLGGIEVPLDLQSLQYPSLASKRRVLVRSLRSLARHPDEMMAALKLGRTQSAEVGRNLALSSSPTMPVLDRYTGVLYDALDAGTLSPADRDWARHHVLVHSALFGPVGALDLIPAYRLSCSSKLPEIALKKHWAESIARVLAESEGLLLDFRSAGYVALGPAPVRPGSVYLRVLAETADGRTRALNHFNKQAKGRFTRALVQHGESFTTLDALLGWAAGAGFVLRPGSVGELDLVVDQSIAAATV